MADRLGLPRPAPLRVQHRDFVLEGVSGVRYEAQPPFQIKKEGPARSEVVPAYGWSGFYLADYLDPLYGAGLRLWPDPIAYDPAYYRVQWRTDLPSVDMLAKSLPEGVLEPGGTVAGFVYFPVVPDNEKRVVFSADLEPVEGRSPPVTVPVGASLEDALATALRSDDGVVGVERDGQLVGVLTPASVHAALRRSVAADADRAAAAG